MAEGNSKNPKAEHNDKNWLKSDGFRRNSQVSLNQDSIHFSTSSTRKNRMNQKIIPFL